MCTRFLWRRQSPQRLCTDVLHFSVPFPVTPSRPRPSNLHPQPSSHPPRALRYRTVPCSEMSSPSSLATVCLHCTLWPTVFCTAPLLPPPLPPSPPTHSHFQRQARAVRRTPAGSRGNVSDNDTETAGSSTGDNIVIGKAAARIPSLCAPFLSPRCAPRGRGRGEGVGGGKGKRGDTCAPAPHPAPPPHPDAQTGNKPANRLHKTCCELRARMKATKANPVQTLYDWVT